MLFTRVERHARYSLTGTSQAFLVDDGWDDFTYKTLFQLVVFDSAGARIDVGGVKIISRNLKPGRVFVPETFSALGHDYCSLGQEENYYESIAGLSGTLGDEVLRGLRDCVLDPEILNMFREEEVVRESLLRFVPESKVLTTFSGALRGQSRLTPFRFAYKFPSQPNGTPPPPITFKVSPGSMPPTNVHVVIGRNGVGKTHLLGNIASALCQSRSRNTVALSGQVEFLSDDSDTIPGERFANLVAVTFSAFDPFRAPRVGAHSDEDIRYAYIGLRKAAPVGGETASSISREDGAGIKGLGELSAEFYESLSKCFSGPPRRRRWADAIRTLETDPGFQDVGLPLLLEQNPVGAIDAIGQVFGSLSAGHKIVLLIVTRLVELVEERTLVLVDEPESHLHPPLLSSFVRVLSNLLTLRNGAGIVATHSPVVLQEVPKECVWVLRRSGEVVQVERPEIETFGENVGVLTREVFGLEVTKSGFHQLIAKQAAELFNNYDAVISAFGGRLGAEARSIARALTRKEE
jgi:ABC-type cobalamin/Fe3+-siderophores transport system ATPase subunit